MTYARQDFELSKPDEKGVTLRSHLEAIERQTGNRPKDLNLPKFPELLLSVWRIFIELSNTRSQGFSGGSTISFEQMKAYNDIMGNVIGPFEVKIIQKLDREYLRIMNNG